MQTYQYKVVKVKPNGITSRDVSEDEITDEFNKLGSEGWELVNSERLEAAEWTSLLIYVFRRPLK